MDKYPGGPYDVCMLIQYHLHVARSMSDWVVRFYNFKFFVQRFISIYVDWIEFYNFFCLHYVFHLYKTYYILTIAMT